jgi:RNA polymerase sigma factor (sigma-70 family)
MRTDEQLVAELAHGNEVALRELLGRYERPLSSFIFRHTGGRDVEDLYQETWIRVVRQVARFDAAKRFSTWLFQIALNLCRDWHRRAPPPAATAPDSSAPSPELARREAALDAAALLAALPQIQREVVILRYFHDLSEAETAAILDCPQGTVKSRLHQALARLTALVQEEEP